LRYAADERFIGHVLYRGGCLGRQIGMAFKGTNGKTLLQSLRCAISVANTRLLKGNKAIFF
jgi:hypothetical protein